MWPQIDRFFLLKFTVSLKAGRQNFAITRTTWPQFAQMTSKTSGSERGKINQTTADLTNTDISVFLWT